MMVLVVNGCIVEATRLNFERLQKSAKGSRELGPESSAPFGGKRSEKKERALYHLTALHDQTYTASRPMRLRFVSTTKAIFFVGTLRTLYK